MAYKFGFSNRGETESMYGDKIVGSDGNGDTYGELVVPAEYGTHFASQLLEIQHMRSEMAQHPLPEDKRVLDYLDFDEIILRSGMDENYTSSILETYPDMPETQEAVWDSPAMLAAIDLIDKDNAVLALKALREAPLEVLVDLEAYEAHLILQVLALEAIDLSSLGHKVRQSNKKALANA